jgi:hypothetical protein
MQGSHTFKFGRLFCLPTSARAWGCVRCQVVLAIDSLTIRARDETASKQASKQTNKQTNKQVRYSRSHTYSLCPSIACPSLLAQKHSMWATSKSFDDLLPLNQALLYQRAENNALRHHKMMQAQRHVPLTLSIEPLPRDILFGRGNDDHPGNCHFQDIIKKHSEAYNATHLRSEKSRMVRNVYRMVLQSSGRFLKYEEDRHEWVEVDGVHARDKISQALRYRCRQRKAASYGSQGEAGEERSELNKDPSLGFASNEASKDDKAEKKAEATLAERAAMSSQNIAQASLMSHTSPVQLMDSSMNDALASCKALMKAATQPSVLNMSYKNAASAGALMSSHSRYDLNRVHASIPKQVYPQASPFHIEQSISQRYYNQLAQLLQQQHMHEECQDSFTASVGMMNQQGDTNVFGRRISNMSGSTPTDLDLYGDSQLLLDSSARQMSNVAFPQAQDFARRPSSLLQRRSSIQGFPGPFDAAHFEGMSSMADLRKKTYDDNLFVSSDISRLNMLSNRRQGHFQDPRRPSSFDSEHVHQLRNIYNHVPPSLTLNDSYPSPPLDDGMYGASL